MEKKLILRGLVAGAIAGLLALVFARIFAEPLIDQAINYESGREAAVQALEHATAAGAHVHEGGGEVFSRTIQANLGLGFGFLLFGAALGAMFAVVYTVCIGRVGRLRPRTLSLLVAAAGFLGVYFVPFLKYPANPPAASNGDTIRARSGLYVLMIASTILLLLGALWIGRRLQARYGNWTASLAAGAFFVVSIGVVMWVLPSLGELAANRQAGARFGSETPQPLLDDKGNIVFPGFPADVLYSFRLYSVAAQALLWGAIGLIFGPLAERVLQPITAGRPTDELIAV